MSAELLGAIEGQSHMNRRHVVASALVLGAGLFFVGVGSERSFAAEPAAGASAYMVDAGHSSVVFKIKHLNVTNFYGTFNDFSGSITIDPANPANCKLDVVVKTDSVDSRNGKRDDHLKSGDFFNSAQFPEMTFKSTKFEAAGSDAYAVTGDLTVKGVSKPITVTLQHTGSGEMRGTKKVGYETSFTIKRSEFGINYMPQGLGEDVTVIVALECDMKK